jgi:hypothetical protein
MIRISLLLFILALKQETLNFNSQVAQAAPAQFLLVNSKNLPPKRIYKLDDPKLYYLQCTKRAPVEHELGVECLEKCKVCWLNKHILSFFFIIVKISISRLNVMTMMMIVTTNARQIAKRNVSKAVQKLIKNFLIAKI